MGLCLGVERWKLGCLVVHPHWDICDVPLGSKEGEEIQKRVWQRLQEEEERYGPGNFVRSKKGCLRGAICWKGPDRECNTGFSLMKFVIP